MSPRSLLRAAVFLLLSAAGAAHAAEIVTVPNELEWAAWPEYCRARFVVSAAGRNSAMKRRVPPSQTQLWESRLGDWWYALHHHCAGLLLQSRGRLEPNAKQRQYLFRTAIREFQYSLDRTTRGTRGFSESLTQQGNTFRLLGDDVSALEAYDLSIATNPTYAPAYAAKALYYRDAGKSDEALEVLLAGDKAVGGQSAEIHYFLGMTYFERGEYEKAREHARGAYSRGYNLPALRNKLASVGFALDP